MVFDYVMAYEGGCENYSRNTKWHHEVAMKQNNMAIIFNDNSEGMAMQIEIIVSSTSSKYGNRVALSSGI